MNIAITTTAKTDEEARELLRLMGAPFATANARGEEDNKLWLRHP